MLLSSHNGKSPAARVPIAMALIFIGMMFTVFGIVWPRIVSPTLVPLGGTDWHDFLRGLCYGLGISFDIGGLVLAVTAVAAQNPKKL
jgi:hypothetical protein